MPGFLQKGWHDANGGNFLNEWNNEAFNNVPTWHSNYVGPGYTAWIQTECGKNATYIYVANLNLYSMQPEASIWAMEKRSYFGSTA
jgi:hypothetical protein